MKDQQTQSLAQLHLRLTPELLAILDAWRRSQPDLPKRQEAIKRLIEATAEHV